MFRNTKAAFQCLRGALRSVGRTALRTEKHEQIISRKFYCNFLYSLLTEKVLWRFLVVFFPPMVCSIHTVCQSCLRCGDKSNCGKHYLGCTLYCNFHLARAFFECFYGEVVEASEEGSMEQRYRVARSCVLAHMLEGCAYILESRLSLLSWKAV